jgi:hypothetical protein
MFFKLSFFLISSYNYPRTLQQSNLILVASHLEVVSSIKQNLRMVAGPSELGQLDYPMLRQFEHAILPPPPMRAIETRPVDIPLPFSRVQRQILEDRYEAPALSNSSQEIGLLGQGESLLKERLDNITKRGMNGTRGDSVPNTKPTQRTYSVVQPVLERLREIRTGFGDAVGLPIETMPEGYLSSGLVDAHGALKEELELWNQLEERIQYDVKRREQLLNRGQILNRGLTTSSAADQSSRYDSDSPLNLPLEAFKLTLGRKPVATPSPRMIPTFEPKPSEPVQIPAQSPGISPNLSPMSSPLLGVSPSSEDWFGTPDSGQFHRTSAACIRLDSALPVVL